MAKRVLLSIGTLHKVLVCDAEAGRLWWRERPLEMFTNARYHKQWNDEYAGKEAFIYITQKGYRRSKIFNKDYDGHRVVWAMHTGAWPIDQIDHKNHIRSDDRFDNLREATNLVNSRNRSLQKNNTSGFTGVQWIKSSGKWDARITINGKQALLGSFTDKQDAIDARKAANIEHGYHANHGGSGIMRN